MNLLFEIIGYIGSALVIFSMFMTSVKYLRMVNMSGSVISIIYAIYFGAYPVLLMNVGKESDPLGLMATSSYVQTIAIFDALLAALIEETGYTAEQFGLIHPGGAVGEHINGKTI